MSVGLEFLHPKIGLDTGQQESGAGRPPASLIYDLKAFLQSIQTADSLR